MFIKLFFSCESIFHFRAPAENRRWVAKMFSFPTFSCFDSVYQTVGFPGISSGFAQLPVALTLGYLSAHANGLKLGSSGLIQIVLSRVTMAPIIIVVVSEIVVVVMVTHSL